MTTQPDPAALAEERIEELLAHWAPLDGDNPLEKRMIETTHALVVAYRELATMRTRGLTLTQEHLDGLLRAAEGEGAAMALEELSTSLGGLGGPELRKAFETAAENIRQRTRGTAAPGDEE